MYNTNYVRCTNTNTYFHNDSIKDAVHSQSSVDKSDSNNSCRTNKIKKSSTRSKIIPKHKHDSVNSAIVISPKISCPILHFLTCCMISYKCVY